jgi:hypothetical protein
VLQICYLPWISRNEDFRKADDVGTVLCCLLDETDGLVDTTLEIVPDGLGLDGGDLEGLGHLDRLWLRLNNVVLE